MHTDTIILVHARVREGTREMERLNVSEGTSLVEPTPLTERQKRLKTCRVSINVVTCIKYHIAPSTKYYMHVSTTCTCTLCALTYTLYTTSHMHTVLLNSTVSHE